MALAQLRDKLKRQPVIVRTYRQTRSVFHRVKSRIVKPKPIRFFDVQLLPAATDLPRRALLTYVVPPLPLTPDDPDFFIDRSIYTWHTFVIARILNELGYKVDLVNWNDTAFRLRARYDLFFGHGGMISEALMRQLPAEAVRIMWVSTRHHACHNAEETARLEELQRRTGSQIPPDRLIASNEEEALRRADGIIGLGNGTTGATYHSFATVQMVNNMVRPATDYDLATKDFEAGRRHFLHFSGMGAVQKGLDYLLEAFLTLPEYHLWIAMPIEPAFARLYRSALFDTPNIHVVGNIRPRGPAFIDLMNRCNFVLSASCGEGQPHAILECMAYGLIPAVSRATGMDVEGFGRLIEPCTIENVRATVVDYSNYSTPECFTLALAAQEATRTTYSEAAFSAAAKGAVEEILAARCQ